MIKRYGDHAANERTFLAWVRTAIAVMAFGFIIERFDLFLLFATQQTSPKSPTLHGQRFVNAAGLAFILLGVVMIVIAAVRFFRTPRTSIGMMRYRAPAHGSICHLPFFSPSWGF